MLGGSIVESQNWRCCYCHFVVQFIAGETLQQNAATFEHVVPLSRGGKDTLSNLVIACMLCNVTRARGNHERFARVIQRLLKNPQIKAFWHNFSDFQMFLLSEEVMYGCVLEKSIKGQPANVRMVDTLKKSRKKLFAKIKS